MTHGVLQLTSVDDQAKLKGKNQKKSDRIPMKHVNHRGSLGRMEGKICFGEDGFFCWNYNHRGDRMHSQSRCLSLNIATPILADKPEHCQITMIRESGTN